MGSSCYSRVPADSSEACGTKAILE